MVTINLKVLENLKRSWKKSWKVIEFEELKRVQNLCTCKIAKDIFRIVLYITTFYMQHYAVAGFIFK